MSTSTVLQRSVGLTAGALGGVLAGAVFTRIWRLADGGRDAPKPTDADRAWGEVLLAAALRGALFAVVRGAIDRAVARSAGHGAAD